MKSICIYIKHAVLVLLSGLTLLTYPDIVLGQGCDQVDIQYDGAPCFEHKGGAAPSNGKDCTPVTVCERQQYNYAAIGGPWASYSWAIISGPATPAINPGSTVANISITWPIPGLYTLKLTVTDGTGNTYTKCLEITVVSKPVAGFTIFPTTVPCASAPFTFTNTTTFSGTAYYAWDYGDPASGPFNTSNGTNGIHTYNSAGTYTVTLIAYSSMLVPAGGSPTGGHGDSLTLVTCCADTFRKQIAVNTGTVKIECISSVCAGAISKYTAVGCASPAWLPPVGGTILSTLPVGTVTVQWGNGNPQGQVAVVCGSCTTYASIPIVPTTPIITGNTSPCNSAPSVYNTVYVPGTTYTWTLTDVTSSSNVTTSMVSIYPENNSVMIDWGQGVTGHVYQLTVNMNNKHLCCSSSGSLTINLKTTFSIFGPSPVCSGGPPVTFTAFPSGIFSWSSSPTTGAIPPLAPSTGAYTVAYTVGTPTTYVVTAVNTSGAFCNDTARTTVSVIPIPAPASAITGPNVACTGSQYSYSVPTPPVGWFYEWTISGGAFYPGAYTPNTTGDAVNVIWSSLSGNLSFVLKQSALPACSVAGPNLLVTQATVGSVTGDTAVCVDGTRPYTLGGNIPPGTIINWTINPLALANLGTVQPPVNSNPATILWHGTSSAGPWGTVTVTASTTCGSGTSAPIRIFPKFTVNITAGSGDICTGVVPLTVNGAPATASYVWGGGQTTQSITATAATGYSVIATKGCTASASFTVPDPFAIFPSGCITPQCNGASMAPVQLTTFIKKPASGTFTYQWRNGRCSAPGAIIATNTNGNLSDAISVSTDGYYCCFVTYGGCTKCVEFLVPKVCCPDLRAPSIAHRQQLSCDTWEFTATGIPQTGDTVIWNFGDGTSAPGASGVTIQHTYTAPGVYCVTYCVGPFNPAPIACIGNCASTDARVPIAAGFSYLLGCGGCVAVTDMSVNLGPGSITYFWDYGDGFTTTSPNPGIHCYSSGGSKTITQTITYTDGLLTCTKTEIKTFIYTPLSITNSAPVCTGTPVQFTSTPGPFVFYNWSFGDGFSAFTQNTSHAYPSPTGYTASLTVTDILGNNCTASTTFTVLSGIDSCTIYPAYICAGDPTTIFGPVGGYTYQWEVETGTPGTFANAPGASTSANYSTNVVGNYRVVVTNTNGCKCTSNTIAVQSVAKPKAVFSISPSKQLCAPGGFVFLTSPSIPGYIYSWFANGSPIGSGPNTGAGVSSNTTIMLVVKNQYQCVDTCIQVITVNPAPTGLSIAASSLCAGVPITLTENPYTSNVTWNNGGTGPVITVHTAGTYAATYTDPATGCSTTGTITINRRPAAGLFPHNCDSIPCKCTRPFAIYAPTPPTGFFNTSWQIDWYDGITNTFLFSGNPYNNGGLGAQTGSYYVVITDQTTGCTDTSNRYSIVVPPCDSCDCKKSSFGEMSLTMTGGNPQFPKCGKTYTLECNRTYSFATSFTCKDTSCKGKVAYKLQPPSGAPLSGIAPVNFTTSQSGTYVLTLYGWCGGRICDSCVIRFTVACPCDCKNSQWGNIVLTQGNGTDDAGAPVFNNPQNLKCGKTYKLDCKKPVTIAASFICADTGCKAKVTYTLTPPVGPAFTGIAPLTFTPSFNGTYTLVLYGWCAGKKCDSCIIRFDVQCGCDCAGSHWADIVLGQSTAGVADGIAAGTQQNLKCGKNYTLDCNSTYTLNTAFFCKDTSCKGKVTYTLTPPGGGPAITGSLPLTFTASVSGVYTLKLYGWCGDKICDSCAIRFTVDCTCDCKGSKWLTKTLNNGTATTTLNCQKYEWACNLPFTVTAAYNCAKTFCNSAVTYSLKPPTGPVTTGNVPLTYTPIQSGVYALVLYGYCGGKVCDSCVVSFVVNCPKDTICCKYDIAVKPGAVTTAPTTSGNATIASQSFTFTGLTGVPLSEVRAEVLSYDLSSSFNNECLTCKTLPFLWASMSSAGSIGAIPGLISLYGGATTLLFNPTGTAVYQNPREVVWNNGTTFTLTGPIGIKFLLPPPSIIDCCELKARVCVKFTFRDIYCNECEVISCFDVIIKK